MRYHNIERAPPTLLAYLQIPHARTNFHAQQRKAKDRSRGILLDRTPPSPPFRERGEQHNPTFRKYPRSRTRMRSITTLLGRARGGFAPPVPPEGADPVREPRDVRCPDCGAEPGERCVGVARRDGTRRERSQAHRVRGQLARGERELRPYDLGPPVDEGLHVRTEMHPSELGEVRRIIGGWKYRA